MPDLSAQYDIPNPFALLAADFQYDLDGYRAALGFLSDLAGGSDHDDALRENGGDPASLRAWQNSDKFRRVYAKCTAAGEAEQRWHAEHAEDSPVDAPGGPSAATGDETGADAPGQRFVPLEEAPVARGAFRVAPPAQSWGE